MMIHRHGSKGAAIGVGVVIGTFIGVFAYV
jgi:hypothetical protein